MTEDHVSFDVAAVERNLARQSEVAVDATLGRGYRFTGDGQTLEVFPGVVRVLVTFESAQHLRRGGWSDYYDSRGRLLSEHDGGEVIYLPKSPMASDQVTASNLPVHVDADIARATIPITITGYQPSLDYRPGGWVDFDTTGQRLSVHTSGIVLLVNKPQQGSTKDQRSNPRAPQGSKGTRQKRLRE
jgi:hypothetical protein